MKLKKRVKVILIIALIVILLAVASIFAYKAFSKPTIKEAKVLKEKIAISGTDKKYNNFIC